MKKVILIAGFLALGIFQSCQNDDAILYSAESGKVILNENTAELSSRLDYSNSGVINLTGSSLLGRGIMDGSSADFPMSLLAEVIPPSYQGVQLTASHVDVKDNLVYVSYNKQGDEYLGGIDVIDVSEPNNPVLIVSAILPNIDITSVQYDGGKLYIAGAADPDFTNEVSTPAFVAKMTLNGGLLTNDYALTSLPSYVTTGLTVTSANYYAVTGSTGVVAKLNKNTNQIETTIDVADLRAIGAIDNKIVVLSGTNGVKVLNASTLSVLSSFLTSNDVAGAKRTIDFQGTNVLVAEGFNGLKVYNTTSGSLVQSLAVPTDIEGVNPDDLVTNAVSVQGDFVYAANGAAGVTVYKKTQNLLVEMGSIDLDGSANYVKSVGDYIFVATGTGGLKIIKKLTVASINCASFPTYNGGAWLNVNSNETLNYQGSAALQGINVNQNLTFCGSLSVSQGVNINSNGVFTMKGSLAQGQYGSNSTNFNVNGTFKVEGSVVIYGNLILNSNAKLEFLGSGSSITIYGNVTKNSNVTITGNYTDTFNKLN
ncbi:hypothetical protein FLAN108750_05055 [Flavobacterium antarcticum]|uniref:hypothetical protein n=1 Tax=Flavobacterium antarcticum TaxID=271155 RepID=UPI0003B69917|nr:hypothetical protein [Flavobacterium antarcticum]